MRPARTRAFTLVEIMIVVMIIGILMAIAVPNFITAREKSRRNTCITNLREIDSAKEQWAMDNKAATGANVLMSDIAGSYMKTPAPGPACPTGGAYSVNVVGTNPACSLATSPNLHILGY